MSETVTAVYRSPEVIYGLGKHWGPVRSYAVVYDDGTLQLCVQTGACSVTTYPSAEECLALARMLEDTGHALQAARLAIAEA